MKKAASCLLWVLTLLAVPHAWSAEYPTRSIRLIVPFAPGGGTDLLARLVTPKLTELLGQQLVVDNRGGAGSVVGTELVAKAPPDGHTLGFFDTAFAINPAVNPALPYNTEKDFSVITIVANSPTMLVVRASLPAKTIEDLVRMAKASPGKLTFGSPGAGSSGHLTGEMFNAAAGVCAGRRAPRCELWLHIGGRVPDRGPLDLRRADQSADRPQRRSGRTAGYGGALGMT